MRRPDPAAAIPYLVVVAVTGLVGLWAWQEIERLREAEAVLFRKPWALILLSGCGLAVWARLWLRRARATTFLFSRVPALAVTRRGWVSRLSSLPLALRVSALGLMALALARPQTYRAEEIEVEGIDIMIVLDLSRSMQERDLKRDRLDAGQRTIREFLTRRSGDRIGLVVFAEEAMLQCPLTLDYASLDRIVASLAIGDVPDRGTAIGDGLGLALASLRRSEAQSKVVVLISDGDSNVDTEMDPQLAKDIAKRMGVRVFTVLMGQEEGSRAQGRRRNPVYAVNPALLRQLAAETGGTYFNAGDDRELEASFAAVRSTLDKSRFRIKRRAYADLFPHLLYAALFLLSLELALRFTRWRRFP